MPCSFSNKQVALRLVIVGLGWVTSQAIWFDESQFKIHGEQVGKAGAFGTDVVRRLSPGIYPELVKLAVQDVMDWRKPRR